MRENSIKINWFPGHMTKALKEIRVNLEKVDVVIYVLDARAPISSINPSLSRLSQNKPILYVVNKIDLADENVVKNLAKRFVSEKSEYVISNSTMSGLGKQIRNKILNLAKEKIEKFKNKGINAVVRALVVGVPNCGKSTLINNLCGKAKLVTGNKPGVTKTTQWLKFGDNIEICDTPGTLYPNLEDQKIARNLYYIGSIKDEIIVEKTELAQDFIEQLSENYLSNLKERFGEDLSLEGIARKRGYILSKNELDIERTAAAILDDFRKGKLGKITLDR